MGMFNKGLEQVSLNWVFWHELLNFKNDKVRSSIGASWFSDGGRNCFGLSFFLSLLLCVLVTVICCLVAGCHQGADHGRFGGHLHHWQYPSPPQRLPPTESQETVRAVQGTPSFQNQFIRDWVEYCFCDRFWKATLPGSSCLGKLGEAMLSLKNAGGRSCWWKQESVYSLSGKPLVYKVCWLKCWSFDSHSCCVPRSILAYYCFSTALSLLPPHVALD